MSGIGLDGEASKEVIMLLYCEMIKVSIRAAREEKPMYYPKPTTVGSLAWLDHTQGKTKERCNKDDSAVSKLEKCRMVVAADRREGNHERFSGFA